MKSGVFQKVTGLVHIQASRQLTLIERKVSNVLLANAYSRLADQRVFEISVEELMGSVGWDSQKDIPYFKTVLENLAQTLLKFNVFGKDKRAGSWEVMTLLASAKIKNGVCRYSYSGALVEKILHSGIYARLDIDICKQFKNRDAHSLWEFLVECLSSRNENQPVETPWITIEEFICKILNKKNKKISFKRINYQYIKKSIKEINKMSNIRVVDTEIEKKKDGVYVRFIIEWANPDSPVMTLVDEDREDVDALIKKYAQIKATKFPKAYENAVKKSLAKGETTLASIQEFLDHHQRQEQKKCHVDDVSYRDENEQMKRQWDTIPKATQSAIRLQAIDSLKKRGFKNIEEKTAPNLGLIKQMCFELMQERV